MPARDCGDVARDEEDGELLGAIIGDGADRPECETSLRAWLEADGGAAGLD
jgi:hypothetical protein